jgi:hypothetical protein
MPIYCDESGYTGVNLLDQNQPYFVFSALNMSEEEVNNFTSYLKTEYKIQGHELKGSNLLKSSRSKKAIQELFTIHSKKCKVVYYDKKFALSGKYFEYVFEPIISERSGFLYKIHFNKFIANVLHEGFLSRKETAEQLFRSFIALLKGENQEQLFHYAETTAPNQAGYWKQIARFTYFHKQKIYEEIYTGNEVDNWVLELHAGALSDLLRTWGETERQMIVLCDYSKPLEAAIEQNELLNTIDVEPKYIDILGKRQLITYNLKTPIKVVDSKKENGVQLADIFASSVAYGLNKPDDSFSKIINEIIEENCKCKPHSYCVMPEHEEHLTTITPEVEFNAYILKKLVEYSEGGLNINRELLREIPKYFYTKNI